MKDYRIHLDIYNGPMDLLLYLIRRDEIDIYDLPIAQITRQYIEYVELIEHLDLDNAGDFLVMAATLMEIKSAMLLPRETAEEGETEDLSDPRLELVRQLLEYKRFKDAAGDLAGFVSNQSQRFNRSLVDLQRLKEELKNEQEVDLENIQIWDLFDAFNKLMQQTFLQKRKHEVIYDDTPIDVYETYILQRAQTEKPLKFEAVFERGRNRSELVGMFLALLELMRHSLVKIEQEAAFGAIYVFPLTDQDPQSAVANTVSAGMVDLPSHINVDHAAKSNKNGIMENSAKMPVIETIQDITPAETQPLTDQNDPQSGL